MSAETLDTPSARLSGSDFTALDTFRMELRRGFTNVSICPSPENRTSLQQRRIQADNNSRPLHGAVRCVHAHSDFITVPTELQYTARVFAVAN